ncbi:MAG: cytochrome c [Rhodocyclaceae bacterium]|nr:cytochrome c [Rhodocyclaceae bacterium]
MDISKPVAALAAAIVALAFAPSMAFAEADAEAAKDLAKESKCTTCHSVNKKKDGPPYKETAEKYRGKADAVDTLYKHLTSNPTVKVKGKEEQHKSPKTDDEAEIRNLIAWILEQ